jgi:hypothetical protein
VKSGAVAARQANAQQEIIMLGALRRGYGSEEEKEEEKTVRGDDDLL